MYPRCKLKYTQIQEPIYTPVAFEIKCYLKPFPEDTQISEKRSALSKNTLSAVPLSHVKGT